MMINLLNGFNMFIFILFLGAYFYQMVYAAVVIIKKQRVSKDAKVQHRFAVMVAARNEETVIQDLIESVQHQDYPKELIDIIVIADNCTDATAKIARRAGAIVFERFNKVKVGKGFALDYAFKQLKIEYPSKHYDGFFVFDADNLLDKNYIKEMNKVFDEGYEVITSYRNSKNYDTNWISAGYSLWFLRESKYLNNARMLLNTSCAISGTGFLVSNAIIEKNCGWKHHLLTEDIEFSVDSVLHGVKIGYCNNAMIYDEQPYTMEQSWKQRLRWSKGFYQVFGNYGKQLFKGVVKGHSFSCYDMMMTITPALFISLASVLINLIALIAAIFFVPGLGVIKITLGAISASILNYYLILFAFGLLTTITEWKNINCPAKNKIKYLFTFPIFIFTYVPISIQALYKRIEWVPIEHTITKKIQQM